MKPYKTLCAEFYDLEPHRDGSDALLFYMKKAQDAFGPVLEPMCGTGRFLIPMLRAGIDIDGFDASVDMLNHLYKKWAEFSAEQPPVSCAYVENVELLRQYKLIFVPYGSWGLITDIAASFSGLTKMFNALLPGGKFIFEIETVSSVPQPCGIWRRGIHRKNAETRIAINSLASFNERTKIFQAYCRYEKIMQGKIVAEEEENFKMYLYNFDEMDAILVKIGFAIENKWQDYKGTPAINERADILIYECVKPEK